ncbi:hypothetical protein EV426DRAFT_220874 [Tirmania nivea]|nr:hypothetical protein EV426DRAFT_220874 [Tirmania nivea]
MLHSALPPPVPASVSFGERRLGQSPLCKQFSLDIALMTAEHQASQLPPYPSPPMTGQSLADNFLPQRNKSEQSSRQERQQNISENTRRSHQGSAETHPEPLLSLAAEESRKLQAVPMTVSSPIGRSPFMVPPPAHSQTQRKTKSHVASACVNCKKAHLACDTRRPCPRCIGLNKQDTCKDVQHKKRGRPRLRDERSHSFEINQIGSVSSQREPTSPLSSPTSMPFPYRANSHRVIKSQTGDSHSRLSRSFNSYALRSPQSGHLTSYFDDRPVHTVPQSELKALLTNGLVIAWSTEQLREFLGIQEYDIRKCMKSLFDIVSSDDRERLYRLSSQIQAEVQMQDATYRPPSPATVNAAIQNTTGAEVAHACAHSRVLQETLDLRLPCGRKYRTVIRMQVVRTSVFFVVAELASVTELPALAAFKASSPTQYKPLPAYGTGHAQIPPYAYHQPKRTLSPAGSRPRSVHSESTYPSLAPYANSSSSNSSQNWTRNPLPSNLLHQGPNFRRHSDQPLAPNNLTLPPLRSFGSLDRPSSAEGWVKTELIGGEAVPLPKRITVQDVLQ